MIWKQMARTAALLAGSLLLASLPGTAAELILEPGSATGGELLAVGDHLWVGAAGLAPGGSADLRLRDPDGRVVAAARVRVDGRGEVPPELLWRRTGVVGCDCSEGLEEGAYRFRTFEEAELALAGTQWTVELVDGERQQLVARKPFRLERTSGFQVYFSDASGCPRRRLEPGENVYLSFRGPEVPESARVFLVADRPSWEEPLPLVEVRPGVSAGGEVIEGLSAPLATLLTWPGDPKGLRSGFFAAVVRTGTADEALELRRGDRLLSHGAWKSVEEGVVIRTWGCQNPVAFP